jgi:hypothetical protein
MPVEVAKVLIAELNHVGSVERFLKPIAQAATPRASGRRGPRIAAALVSPNGHNRTRPSPNCMASFLEFPNQEKGMTMRFITASVIIATLSLGTPAFAQAQAASPPPQAQQTPAESSTVIRSIQVVDIKQLQPEVRAKIDEIVAQTSEEDLQSLRKSIDATKEAASALKAKGLNSSHVVAVNIADGVLTMITKAA